VSLRQVNTHSLRGRCPLPTHHSEESRDSFTATLNKGVGGAWACQSKSCSKARERVGGNVLDFVAAMEQCSVRDAAIKLQTWFLVSRADSAGVASAKDADLTREPSHEEDVSESTELEPNKPLAFTLSNINMNHPSLAERGVTRETA